MVVEKRQVEEAPGYIALSTLTKIKVRTIFNSRSPELKLIMYLFFYLILLILNLNYIVMRWFSFHHVTVSKCRGFFLAHDRFWGFFVVVPARSFRRYLWQVLLTKICVDYHPEPLPPPAALFHASTIIHHIMAIIHSTFSV